MIYPNVTTINVSINVNIKIKNGTNGLISYIWTCRMHSLQTINVELRFFIA